MTEQAYEYRISWQREGLRRQRTIRQTEAGARAKVAALEWSDEQPRTRDPDDPWTDPFSALPKLVGPPTIERRAVGQWEPVA